MLFTEFSFIFVFLPITLSAYYLAGSVRNSLVILIVASLIFYGAWNYRLVPVLVFAIIINYFIALQIERRQSRTWFVLGIVLALVPLMYFKYSGFFLHNVGINLESGVFGEKLGSLLPLGISFYTFQQITYLSDVRLGRIKPGGFLEYAFFKTFFPQLIAGPIVHYSQLVPQVGKTIDRDRMFVIGTIYFLIGFVKKFFLADGFAAFSDPIFDATGPVDTQAALIATLGYTFQIYFDFSGYSDMALGLARLFGFKLPWNFNSPYKSLSISDFWRRWHMTLSQFLRDYLYIPLSGNRRGPIIQYRNLLLTMLIGGLWHGAAWTFVVWGGLHGLALAINHIWHRYIRLPLYGLGWPITFILVALLWVLFRAPNFERATQIYEGLASFGPLAAHDFWKWAFGGLALALLLPNSQQIAEWISKNAPMPEKFSIAPFCRRVGIYATVSSVILYGLTAAYYTTALDRSVYAKVHAPGFPKGMDNKQGDFRNNLWAKELFSKKVKRIALAGSSFVGTAGVFRVTDSNGVFAFSQTLGMGGNGILNGARQVDAIARTGAVDVVFLGVSPLNFGSSIPYAPFQGQCMEGISTAARGAGYELDEAPESNCLPAKPAPMQYWGVFSSDLTSVFQFRNFVHTLVLSIGQGSTFNSSSGKPFPEFSIAPSKLSGELDAIKQDILTNSSNAQPLQNPTNGADEQFHWRSREIGKSLQPGGLGYIILAHLKAVAEANGVQLVVYETPTVNHESAPTIYPEGFFDEYQVGLRNSLKQIGIPYIDLSHLYPWNGTFAYDFIHLKEVYRHNIHKILLSWLYAPDVLRSSGLVASEKLPGNQSAAEVWR